MRCCLSLLLLALAVSAAPGQDVSPAEQREGFVSLFNGHDFFGWQFAGGGYGLPEPLPANWKVDGGLIKLSGGGSPHLGTQWDYEDFDARFQWRALRKNYNSGFYVRSGRRVGANQINLAKGGEGGFLGGKLTGAHTVPALQKPALEWNEWRVLAVGDKLTFWCNGQLAWEGTGFRPRRGYLGLQAEGAPMEFRNLRIREIGWQALNDLGQWTGAWKQQGDALTPTGKAGALETAHKSYGNYVLRLEWRAEQGQAAVRLRGAGSGKAVVQLGGAAGSGGLPGYGVSPVKRTDNPPGQWNYLEVRVRANRATVWLNGAVVAADVALAGTPETGALGLSADGPGVQFRNIRIRENAD
jgi:hypothetical protein